MPRSRRRRSPSAARSRGSSGSRPRTPTRAETREAAQAGGLRNFNRKFGPAFLRTVPTVPGIYRIFDERDLLIYIGKAKNLRRRLSQYRNAKRRKKHFKMRAIVGEAVRIEYETCGSDLEACLLEARLIQAARPKWNVAGAFSFMYPLIGIRQDGGAGALTLCLTTEPERCAGFELHGAFRSRHIAGDAFFAWTRLLGYVAHRVPRRAEPALGERTWTASFRRFPPGWAARMSEFLRGGSSDAAAELVLALADVSGARHKARRIQEDLNLLKRFWRHEILPLHRARSWEGSQLAYPVPQAERDFLFLRYRHRNGTRPARSPEAGV